MSGPEASSRPTDSRSPSVPRLRLQRQLFCYLVVGGLTVVVDIGLLALLHESYGVSLGLATTVAFCTAVVVNFLLNRTAMSSWGSRGLTQHALRYGSLVVANYVITLAVVTTAGHVGDRYLVAKVAVVAASTSWNFLLYRHWVFTPPRPTSSKRDRVPWFGGSGTGKQDPGHEHQAWCCKQATVTGAKPESTSTLPGRLGGSPARRASTGPYGVAV